MLSFNVSHGVALVLVLILAGYVCVIIKAMFHYHASITEANYEADERIRIKRALRRMEDTVRKQHETD